ncbi:hypothetical protein BAUCODRAFT_152314 [Baudoinia panamericana UAMH 10762]|uniref:Uncharacterized protein n=1 Tax=Baudoinia panamericana (strain UAMH 10762) TaxID=717646 RepID=M2M5Q8_BAUPA|nr:uncharacterized protein BAUCODRAFT_152314 [Baudoinia panamericana UAMH 10762]EMC91966.1 hypothetical protein BAUCODRAFT_152314 [Baudoinia panamericana UAMH 10762]
MPEQLVWFVTGCSSGFGQQFIKQALERGDKAIATARNADTLKELADLGAATMQLDVTVPMSEIQKKVRDAIKIYGRIDVCVANAGYTKVAAAEDFGNNNEDLLKMIQTNTIGNWNVVCAIAPHWRERKSGFLVYNSSMAAWWHNTPGLGGYAATKAALDRLVEHFRLEATPFGVKVLVIHPGYCRTEIANPTKHDLSGTFQDYEALGNFWKEFTPKLHGGQPGDATKAVRLMIDVVRGEGVAEGKEAPPFLPVGSDAFADIKAKSELTMKILDEWESAIKSIDVAS